MAQSTTRLGHEYIVQASERSSDTHGYFRFPPIFHPDAGYVVLSIELMGRSAASGKMGEMGLGNMGISSHFSLLFLPLPPVFRHFSAKCRGRSCNFHRDLMTTPPLSPHFPAIPPIFPRFSIFPFFPRRLVVLGNFGFGYEGGGVGPRIRGVADT